MKLKIHRNLPNPWTQYREGTEVEVPEEEGKQLLRFKRGAVELIDEPKAEVKPEISPAPEPVQAESVKAEAKDAKPAITTKKPQS